MPSFDLLTQPWVPCLLADGTTRDLSLLEALRGAEHIAELADPSPLVTVALLRLLLAILHAALRPDRDAWEGLWATQRLPLATVEEYLRRWQPRFDLFDATHPFYQQGGLPQRLAAPVRRLAAECSSGRRATLFDHHQDDYEEAVSAATAARWLVTHQTFCPSGCLGGAEGEGLRPARSGPWAYAAVTLPTGDNLLQTLLLNWLPAEALAPWWEAPGSHDDTPVWECGRVGPAPGYLASLTWQSRRIELLPQADGSVRRVIVTPGAALDGSVPLRDPWLTYYVSADLTPRLAAVRVEPDSNWWRDLPLSLRSTPFRRRPLVIDWLAEQSATGVIAPRHVHGLTIVGLEGSGRRQDRWQHQRCRLPAVLLGDQDCAADFHRALERAGEYHEALQAARWLMAQGQAGPGAHAVSSASEAAVRRLAQGAASGYWAALETPAQLLALRMQGNEAQRDEALRWWDKLCYQQAWVCLERESDRAGQSARHLRAEVAARRHLARCLQCGGGEHRTRRRAQLDTAV